MVDRPPASPKTGGARHPAAPPASEPRPTSIEQVLERFHDRSPDAAVMVAAHRGYWQGAPENSRRAVELAVDKGAQIVEVDVRRTADGHVVLMHDATVDRTTDGSGVIADLTLPQVRSLRLRSGTGGGDAPVTDHRIPTLAEILPVVRGRAMLNLDRAWCLRDDIVPLLYETGTLEHALFKSAADPAEVASFLAAHPSVRYMHIVDRCNHDVVGAFPRGEPPAYEIQFDHLLRPQVDPGFLRRVRRTSRIWVNPVVAELAGGYSERPPAAAMVAGWRVLIERVGADVIQTDHQELLLSWLAGDARARSTTR